MHPLFYLRLRRNLTTTAVIPPFLSLFCSSAASRRRRSYSSTSIESPTIAAHNNKTPLFDYLTQKLSLPEPLAITILNRFQWIRTTENPESVVQILHQFGFSDSQVRTTVRKHPQVLGCDVDKVLKPKLQFLRDQLGLAATTELGNIVSKNPHLLTSSLDKRLVPVVTTLKQVLIHDEKNRALVPILSGFMFFRKDAHSRMLSNLALLGNRNVVGSQLATLLRQRPFLLFLPESELDERVRRVVEMMGVPVESRIFVYALSTISGMTVDNLRKKFDLIRSFGFSEDECMEMFRKCPTIFGNSEKRLKCGMEFFLNLMGDVHFERSVLVRQASFLCYSIEKRVIPRLRVLRVIKSNRLTKKGPSLGSLLSVSEKVFMERYVLRYEDHVEKLLAAYKGEGDLLDSSSMHCKIG